MSLHNIRLELMQTLEKNIETFVDKFLITPEKIWQPTDFLPNSQSDNFLEEVKEIQEYSNMLLKYHFFSFLLFLRSSFESSETPNLRRRSTLLFRTTRNFKSRNPILTFPLSHWMEDCLEGYGAERKRI